MRLYSNLYSLDLPNPTACALGNFDGVHLGHQKLIFEMLTSSKDNGLESTIVTFEPHPSRILDPDNVQPLILTSKKKQTLMQSLGVQNMLCVPFTKEFSMMNYTDFIYDILIERCKVKTVVAGFDYRFGYKGQGDVHRLKEICNKEGIEVIIVDPLFYKGYKVSSTLIRNLIRMGDVKSASAFLGRAYSIEGNVVSGDARGRKLGFPTANISFCRCIVLPLNGVYAVTARWRDKTYKGIANVGFNPTFDGNDIRLEVHLFDFDSQIYGEWLEVFFVDNLRKEIKFDSPSDLVKQVNIDLAIAKKTLAEI